ncbi:MAG: outer membrane lipoprotein-sorting protein [Woeseiaceae bacterium]|nr:outer membrane lipoprotein-sorting protein [Woeseiaceae bacterium]
MRTLLTVTSLILALPSFAADALTDADEIVTNANLASYYAGADGRSEVRMIITDSQGRQQRRQFTVLRRNVEEAGDQQFLVVFSQPSDVRNTVFLVDKHLERDDDRWLYLPGLDLVKRISAGDKRTSFVGAHYFYEDVSGRRPSDDEHVLVETTDDYYVLDHTPKDAGTVEFASYTTWVDRQTFLPMKIEYRNAAGDVYRRVEVTGVEEFDGHPTVTTSRVSDLQTGGKTDMQFRFIKYDVGLPEDVFTERSLRSPPREWLARPKD